MATMKIILRPSARGPGYAGSLSLRFIHRREVRQVSTALKLYAGEWDAASESILPGEADTARYPYLQKASVALQEYRDTFTRTTAFLETKGSYHTDDIVRQYRLCGKLSSLTGFTGQQASQLERSGSERTGRAYRTACRMLILFNNGHDIPLKHINRRLVREYEGWLKSRGKAMNTISFHMRMLRALYWRAVKEKLIKPQEDNPFEGVFTGFQQTRKRALGLEEMRRLDNLDFSLLLEEDGRDSRHGGLSVGKIHADSGLYMSWRLFMFCFHARGMSFVDLAHLKKENVCGDRLSYYRRKTGRLIEITLSPVLKRIIRSFSEETAGSAYLFPIIRDTAKPVRRQYENALRLQNKRLKSLSRLAGIGGCLSTHVSRHSWATLGKKQRLPLWVISEGLGHATEKMTYTYLASFDTATLDRASERIARAIRPVRLSPAYTRYP